MRRIKSCASSTAETFFAAMAADSSVAVLKLHCDLAKASLLPSSACLRRMMLSSSAGCKTASLQAGGVAAGEYLPRQHPLHDAVEVDEDVGHRRQHVDGDHDEQCPPRRLMPAIDRLPGRRIVRSQHRQRRQKKEGYRPAAKRREQPTGYRRRQYQRVEQPM